MTPLTMPYTGSSTPWDSAASDLCADLIPVRFFNDADSFHKDGVVLSAAGILRIGPPVPPIPLRFALSLTRLLDQACVLQRGCDGAGLVQASQQVTLLSLDLVGAGERQVRDPVRPRVVPERFLEVSSASISWLSLSVIGPPFR